MHLTLEILNELNVDQRFLRFLKLLAYKFKGFHIIDVICDRAT